MTAFAPTVASLIGRWANTSDGYTVLSGSSVMRFKFTGTSCSLTCVIKDTTYPTEIEWRIDGGAWQRSVIAATTTLATGLAGGGHTADVRAAGIDEYNARWTAKSGLTVSYINADSVSAWPRAGKRFLVVGDSIAEGRLVLGVASDGNYPDQPPQSSGHLGYPQLLADAHGAELYIFAFGGASLINSYAPSGFPAIPTAFPYSMSGIAANDPIFDVVLIEAGNNDGGANSATFRTAYANLVDQIKAASPTASIFCIEPLNAFDPGDARGADIQYVAGVKGCTFINADAWSISSPNLGHPDTTGHAQIATYLESTVGAALGSASITTTGSSDHIALSWNDNVTGETSWRVEKRKIS